jgi:hypothetical protein
MADEWNATTALPLLPARSGEQDKFPEGAVKLRFYWGIVDDDFYH